MVCRSCSVEDFVFVFLPFSAFLPPALPALLISTLCGFTLSSSDFKSRTRFCRDLSEVLTSPDLGTWQVQRPGLGSPSLQLFRATAPGCIWWGFLSPFFHQHGVYSIPASDCKLLASLRCQASSTLPCRRQAPGNSSWLWTPSPATLWFVPSPCLLFCSVSGQWRYFSYRWT